MFYFNEKSIIIDNNWKLRPYKNFTKKYRLSNWDFRLGCQSLYSLPYNLNVLGWYAFNLWFPSYKIIKTTFSFRYHLRFFSPFTEYTAKLKPLFRNRDFELKNRDFLPIGLLAPPNPIPKQQGSDVFPSLRPCPCTTGTLKTQLRNKGH